MQNETNYIVKPKSQPSKLIIVMGLPGSGKSYFAKRLASRLDAKYINSDLLRKNMGMSGKYTLEDKTFVYGEMEKLTDDYIKAKHSVVVDATFYLRQFRNRFVALAQRHLCPYYLIQIVTDDELAIKRVSKPRKDSEADLAVYHLVKNEFEPIDGPYLTIYSTGDNVVQMLEFACNYIEEQ